VSVYLLVLLLLPDVPLNIPPVIISDIRAILSVNLLKNGIGVEQARALVIILKEHSTLKSLCGNNGDETELDMRGKMKGAGDAIMLVPEIIDNGALTRLDISSNNLVGEKGTGRYKDGREIMAPDVSGIIAIANAIPNMRALTSLDLSSNRLEDEGSKIIAEAIKVPPGIN
jgi:hypothetical protein